MRPHKTSISVLIIAMLINLLPTIAMPNNDLKFLPLNSDGEMPSDNCSFTFIDSEGFMWIGTEEGVVRYDGYETINLMNIVNNFSENKIYNDVVETKGGVLWFATSTGLVKYNKKTASIRDINLQEHMQNFNIARKVDAIVYDGNHSLWFGNPTGLYQYNINNDSITHFRNLSNRKAATAILDLVIDKDDKLWLSTWQDGIVRFDPHTQKHNNYLLFNDFEDKKKNNQVNSLVISEENHLYVGSWGGGLYILDIEQEIPRIIRKFYPGYKFTVSNKIITAIAQHRNGDIWVGTPSGLTVINNPLATEPNIVFYTEERNNPYAIGNNSIFDIQQDATGVMWLATRGGGVYKVNPERHLFELYEAPQSVHRPNTNRVIHSFYENDNSQLYVGTQSQLLTTFNPDSKSFTATSFPWKHHQFNTAKCFLKDVQGKLWIGLRYSGLLRYDASQSSYFNMHNRNRLKNFFAQEVTSLKEDSKHNIWVASNNGVYKITLGSNERINDFKVTAIKSKMVEGRTAIASRISDIIIDKNDHLWVATDSHGLLRTTNPIGLETEFEFEIYDSENESCNLKSNHLLSLFEDSEGNIWVGTGGDGLKYWDQAKNQFLSPNKNKQLKNIIFMDIEEDRQKRIWTTTNRGLYCFTPNNFGEYHTEIFSKVDGLQSNMFTPGAFYRMRDGRFAIGGPRGFNIFSPEKIQPDNYIPSVRITEIVNNTTPLNPYSFEDKEVQSFKHRNNDFMFSFSSLDFRHPSKNTYTYKLEGLDSEWKNISSKSKTASYSNLPKGTYTFKVKGSNYMGLWSDQVQEIHFKVKQAPYKTWWAIILYISIISILIWQFILLRIEQINTKNKLEIEKIEHQKSDNLNQFKLQFFTNLSHELLTPLSVLKVLSDQWEDYLDDDSINIRSILYRNVNYLRTQIRKTLQFRKVERGDMSLNVHETDIPALLVNILENYRLIADDKKIKFDTYFPKRLNGSVDSEKIDIIVNNLLSNAFKYTDSEGKVSLKLDVLEKEKYTYIDLIIKDDGQGIPKEKLDHIFERFYRINQINSKAEGLGIGLALVNNLTELHGGKIEVNSKLGFGTTFKVTIPISKEFYTEFNQDNVSSMFDADKIENKSLKSRSITPLKIEHKQNKTILILEDDRDFLALLKSSFAQYFNTLTASNGVEGLKIAGEQEIDLIVTDNMMPEMTGIEFIRQLKGEVNTSHIPIVLITADQNEDMRFQAYEAGVDSILLKPLNVNILLTRVDALLKKKEGAIKVFKKGDFFEPSELAITTMDENLLEKLKCIVEERLEDPNLNVKVLQDELGLSQSQLYRKTKGILAVTPNYYIKNIRLRRAAQIIEADSKINISDVAFKFGFNDLSYFGVCFKKQFGVSPRSYQKGERRKE